ncbi:large-conductance mechanosensitive channel protein MscL [Haploplasma axanthum]|uniref:Large-conductance mechanosensitive channel n=1 Tax=Haploplasma axanthum TaxID=29552 RepID=A0A449BD15_HAPAX|nr:large-conductance mechanosensitive channel protein MscL [Haploplasma axanthum]VEU80344.1 large conductance mechanosensitive channel protein [Haploplasma axanthum]
MSKKDKQLDRKKKTKGFFKGFKDFVMKGNVIDLAVGVIIGGAFGKIVNSLVKDIIMPPVGLLIGGVDFADLTIVLKEAVIENDVITKPAVAIAYGNFISVILEFLIIAFSIYSVLTLVIRRRQFEEKLAQEEAAKIAAEEKAKAEEPAPISEEILLLREIRDSLKEQK